VSDAPRTKIGALARATGISVRTLRYYEQLALLRPAQRTARGHRLYGERELLRLQQVLSLRALGLSLDEVRSVLARRDVTPLEVIERHVTRVRVELEDRTRLLARLESVAARLRNREKPTAELLLRAIEETAMIDRPTLEKYFAPEQLKQLTQARAGLAPSAVRAEADAWRSVIADVRAAVTRGLSPDDPSLAPIAARWIELLRALGADDPSVRGSLARLYRGERTLSVQWGLDGGVDRFVGAMLRANGWK
jgi:DNA-binding transcriptional MerR regulator